MSVDAAFFEQGFRLVAEAMAEAVGKAGLHLRPERLTRAAARRCGASFRQISGIVRRLIFLMALQVQLAPARPRARQAPQPLPEGVEDVTASFGPQPKGFALAPPQCGPPPASLRCVSGVRSACDVSPARLTARWKALYRVLKDPDAHARRLAHTLRRWREAGEAAPACLPSGLEHRLPRELGLLARALPQMIRAAWNDTG